MMLTFLPVAGASDDPMGFATVADECILPNKRSIEEVDDSKRPRLGFKKRFEPISPAAEDVLPEISSLRSIIEVVVGI